MRAKTLLAGLALLAWSIGAAAQPKIEHWTLDNGARVYFTRTTELPMVQLRAVFDAASSRDPQSKPGVAQMTNSMLRQGAGRLSADEIAAGFESLGAEFGSSSERDMAVVELRSLSDANLLDPALDLFSTVLTRPTFPADALDRERARALVALQRDLQQPGTIAEKTFMRQVYGDHPYAHDPLGTAESLRGISRADLAAHHARYYTGANALIAIVGDVTKDEAREIAKRTVGRLARGEKAPPLPAAPMVEEGQRKLIEFPAQQSHVRLGHPGMRRDSPDFFPLTVGNYTLGGGGLVSRLSEEIREKRGFAYSVYSYFLPMRAEGPFVTGLQTRNAQRDEAIAVVRAILAEFAEKGPTEQELQAAKRHLTGSFPLRIDSNKKLADNLAYIGFYGLPLDYLDTYVERIQSVTAEQVRAAFKRHLHPKDAVTVVVGGGEG